MKKLLFLAMLVTAVTACDSDDNNEPFAPQELEFEVLANGFHVSTPWEEQETIIQNQTELENLLGSNPNPESPLANFDFENYQMIAIFGEFKNETRFYIIDNIVEYESEIIIEYTLFYSGGISMETYQPWIFVKMPKSNKPIVFEMEDVLIED
ncbi:MAG: hypothetical protein RBR78_10145 [Flavobacteriaceae bacterium]|jgi:hypothetical protein|nr:hypothetical protein [Flavobacteriaceae bacterium]